VLHFLRPICVASQKACLALLNSTTTFQHWLCTKNSIRLCEVTEMRKIQSKPLRTSESMGRKAIQTTCDTKQTRGCVRGELQKH
jgi:hypothetical protein